MAKEKLREKRIEKCAFCGRPAAQRHHMNPLNPRTVPVCERCHKKLHKKLKVSTSNRKVIQKLINQKLI